MNGDNRSFASILMHVGDDWHVRCSTYEDQSPILSVDAGSTSVTISNRKRSTDDNAVKFARDLLRQVQAFADEVERLHAERSATDAAELPERAA